MRKRLQLDILALAVLGIFVVASSAPAADSDRSQQATCAAIKIFECTVDDGCRQVTAQSIDVPQMFRIDFGHKTITGVLEGKERVTPIEHLERIGGKLILSGAESSSESARKGVAWNAVIDEVSGNLVFSASGDDAAFVIFGACIAR